MKKDQLHRGNRSGYRSKGVALGLWVAALTSVVVSEPAWAINGGTSALNGEFPFAVEITGPTGHLCSGTIISASDVLTAASCVAFANPGDLRVLAGARL
jgi:hypothetical protein